MQNYKDIIKDSDKIKYIFDNFDVLKNKLAELRIGNIFIDYINGHKVYYNYINFNHQLYIIDDNYHKMAKPILYFSSIDDVIFGYTDKFINISSQSILKFKDTSNILNCQVDFKNDVKENTIQIDQINSEEKYFQLEVLNLFNDVSLRHIVFASEIYDHNDKYSYMIYHDAKMEYLDSICKTIEEFKKDDIHRCINYK